MNKLLMDDSESINVLENEKKRSNAKTLGDIIKSCEQLFKYELPTFL